MRCERPGLANVFIYWYDVDSTSPKLYCATAEPNDTVNKIIDEAFKNARLVSGSLNDCRFSVLSVGDETFVVIVCPA